MEPFKRSETDIRHQNFIHKEIKGRIFFNSENSYYHWDLNLLSSNLPSKNIKNKIHRTVILPVVLYGCETWSLTSREEHRLKVFENWVLRKMFGAKREEHRLKVFENWVLRKMFGAKREEIKGKWKRVHTEELNDPYRSRDNVPLTR